jgi:DNA replication and repair protein RecF
VTLDAAVSEKEIAAAFSDTLTEASERERRTGTTVVGPHRDDLLLRLEDGAQGVDLRTYGSGGQRRTAALALRLVEARTIRETRRRSPLVLLDDVFAELDSGRGERVLALMEKEEMGQVVLTSPKEGDVKIRKDSLPRWRIQAGRITA